MVYGHYEEVAEAAEKIKTIMEWNVPANFDDIRYFMGLARYYQRFIEGFSKISYPITTLQKNGNIFMWTVYANIVLRH